MASEKGKEVARNYAEASAGKRSKVVVGHFHEEIPKEIVFKTKTGCNWRVSVVDLIGCDAIDNGWPTFSMCHNLKIGNLLTFKVLGDDEFRITVFDTDGMEVIRKCEEHPRNILLIRAATPPVA